MKALRYRGILDTGYRWDARDGQYKLLDVNPRIGATFRLFVGADGMDVLRAVYLDLTGRPVPPSSANDGRQWLVEHLDLRSAMTYVRRGDISAGEWLRSLRHIDETAWWERMDPVPFLAESAWLLSDQLRKRIAQRLRRRPSG
jgi:predicted ATP-grasp superfamily ATP-dependent carboligase